MYEFGYADKVAYFYPINFMKFIFMSQQDDLQYDEDDAVKFIRNFLPGEVASKFSDDDINYVIDLIYEFYESKGYMDENNDSEVDIIEDELTEYVITNARKNGFTRFDADDVSMVVQGELEYCDSIGMFE